MATKHASSSSQSDAETQLVAKDQQIADQKSEFARLKDLIAAETAAREKDKEQFNGKIEQLQKDHSGEIEQLNAVLRAGKATFDESKTIFDESKAAFDETFNAAGKLASTSQARKRSAGAMEVTPQPSGSSLVMATTTSPLNSFWLCPEAHWRQGAS